MNPSANLEYFLTHYCDKEDSSISVPDSTLGDMQFQDEYESFVKDTNGKILITLKIMPYSPEKQQVSPVREAIKTLKH
jgi:hypothetical protein